MDSSLPKLHLSDTAPISSSRTTFRRKGNTYVIKSEESNEDVIDVFKMIDTIYEEISNKSYWASIKAQIYKFCHILISILIIVLGAVGGSLGASNYNIGNKLQLSNVTSIEVTSIQSIFYAQTVMGFCITIMKSLSSLLNLEQRSMSMKQISVQLRRIARAIKMLKNETMPVNEYYKKLDEFNLIIDSLDINMFGEMTYTTLETTNKQVDHIKNEDIKKNDVKINDNSNDVTIVMNNI